MRRSRTGMPRAALLGGVLAALALLPASASALGTTYYASAYGAGTECSVPAPCELAMAISKAGDGDSVRLLDDGEYVLPFSGVAVKDDIDIGGVPGAVPTVRTTGAATIQVTPLAGASVHDLDFIGQGNLPLESGSAERVSVAFTGKKNTVGDTAACELGPGTTLRDSLCWANEAGDETAANGVEAFVFGEGVNTTVVVRNVTAIAADEGGSGLVARAGSGAKLVLDAGGVIARSAKHADVVANTVGASFPETKLKLVHSNYGTATDELPRGEATPAGAAGNQTAAPLFVDSAKGDFREQPGSPTVDGGATDAYTGSLALDGGPRAQPGCLGAASVPDIGAYELTGTEACPPPPPKPPEPTKPPEPPKPVFRIVKVTLHGPGGSIQVETPGAGMVTLAGSGVKLVTRATSGPQIVKMPIQPWAITLVRANRSGKTTVRLKVRFAPLGAPPKEKTRSVVLKAP